MAAGLVFLGLAHGPATMGRAQTAPTRGGAAPSRWLSGLVLPASHVRGYTPRHERVRSAEWTEPIQLAPGEILVEPPATSAGAPEVQTIPEEVIGEEAVGEGPIAGPTAAGGLGCAAGCIEPCGAAEGCAACPAPCVALSLRNLEVLGGVHAATGPVNRGETASFGFDYGVNWGAPLYVLWGGAFGGQVGFRAVHSNYEGAEFSDADRNQFFLTAGLFRRVDWGLQGGVVVDHMHDNWYFDNADFVQLRGELSWMFRCRHEVGFWFAAALSDDDVISNVQAVRGQVTQVQESLILDDLYAFFYRHRFDEAAGTEGRLFAGFTSESDGLLGGDFRAALGPKLSLQADFAYLIPDTPAGATDHGQEAWSVAAGLVWFPWGRPLEAGNYYRPLFAVASNSVLFVDRE